MIELISESIVKISCNKKVHIIDSRTTDLEVEGINIETMIESINFFWYENKPASWKIACESDEITDGKTIFEKMSIFAKNIGCPRKMQIYCFTTNWSPKKEEKTLKVESQTHWNIFL